LEKVVEKVNVLLSKKSWKKLGKC